MILGNGLDRDQRLKLVVRRYLRDQNLLTDHTPSSCESENIGDTACRDERYLIEEIKHTAELQQRNPLLNPLYGGGMRYSPFCGVPVEWYRQNIAPLYKPNQRISEYEIRTWDREELETAIRAIIKGIVVRDSRLYKLTIHGPHCGWAKILGYGLAQQIWLTADGCRALEGRAVSSGWGQFKVYGTYHEHFKLDDGTPLHRTYAIKRTHPLFERYSTSKMMTIDDESFLRLEAMDWIRTNEPELFADLQLP